MWQHEQRPDPLLIWSDSRTSSTGGDGMNSCAYCGRPLPKGRFKYCCDLHERLWWYRLYEDELSIPGRRPTIPGAWEYVRDAAIKLAGHKCQRCGKSDDDIIKEIRVRMDGAPRWLINHTINSLTYFEVHHRVPLYLGGNSQLDNLIVLCKDCHKEAHKEIRIQCRLNKQNQQTLPQAVTL